MELGDIRSAHIIGIGGSGVSAVARWLASRGVRVTGSDGVSGSVIIALRLANIPVVVGHSDVNLPADVDVVIHSTAVPQDNPELLAAVNRGLTIYSYPQVLGWISNQRRTLAVAGTNGKSTTTALLASILEGAGKDPLVIIGASVTQWAGANYRAGSGDFVVEACEHQVNFLELHPAAITITNITEDHLDFYGSFDAIERAFVAFIRRLPKEGTLVYNVSDIATHGAVMASGHSQTIPFSIHGQTTKVKLWANAIDQQSSSTTFLCSYGNEVDVPLKLPLVGEYNVANALAAIGLALAPGLAAYRGLSRRLELVGKSAPSGALVVSDYAHHPDAIRACLDAVTHAYPGRRRLVLFQPHQGNRTRRLMEQFGKSFNGADQLIIAEVYRVPGREHGQDAAVSSSQLVTLVHQHQPNTPVAFAENENIAEDLARHAARPNDVVVVMGAGTIDGVARRLVGT